MAEIGRLDESCLTNASLDISSVPHLLLPQQTTRVLFYGIGKRKSLGYGTPGRAEGKGTALKQG